MMTNEIIPFIPMWRSQPYFYPIVIILCTWLSYYRRRCCGISNEESITQSDPIHRQGKFITVPFFVSSNSSSAFMDSVRALNQYEIEIDRIIVTLTKSYDEAIRTEQVLFNNHTYQQNYRLSSAIESRISQIAEILESDKFVLEKLLRPFPITLGLPSPCYEKECGVFRDEVHVHPSNVDPMNENNAYNSGAQIIAHITRDWTFLGRPIRKSLYEFCILQLLLHRNDDKNNSNRYTVLVPGAGLARLPKDIFDFGFHVEANEISTTMASAAFHLLHGSVEGVIHPFAFDFLMNEIESKGRYETIHFPDHEMIYIAQRTSEWQHEGSLSYTVGDFIETYSPKQQANTFNAVVTCFFIDTASNIYDYVLVIRNVLKDCSGIWINVGPLQWHSNSKLRPSADELRLIIEAMGFSIRHWSVDKDPMNYRNNDGIRYTKYEGYHPLRFVAVKK